MLIQANGAPYHDAFTSPSAIMFDVGVSKALSGSSTDFDADIDMIQAEPLVVREEDPLPVPKTPTDVILGTGQTVCGDAENEERV